MSKDRNALAKRKKSRPASAKKEPRVEKKPPVNEWGEPLRPEPLSDPEHSVLGVFRKYLMTPGEMLCFGTADLDTFRTPLAQLAAKGMLIAEKSKGGYSLTPTGFAAMKNG